VFRGISWTWGRKTYVSDEELSPGVLEGARVGPGRGSKLDYCIDVITGECSLSLGASISEKQKHGNDEEGERTWVEESIRLRT
jgi:hypothetical protein